MAPDIRAYLMETYGVEVECVKNGADVNKSQSWPNPGADDSWIVYGQIPGTTEKDWFFAGHSAEIELDIKATFE
jgi:hypothetical protein